jgi:Tfp pilus assembly protein PilN
MIKVNLLEGAADTRASTRATKAAAKTTQQVLLIAGALVTLLVAVGVDYYVSKAMLDKAERDLAEQKTIAEELKRNREQLDALQKQIKSVEERIKIIDDLQKTQLGPSALLALVNSKMPGTGVRLQSIIQTRDDLTIKGVADTQEVVSEFARGLELGSNGLFQSVGLEVSRKEEQQSDPADETIKKLVVVYEFSINTKYTPTLVGMPPAGDPAAQPGGAGAPAKPVSTVGQAAAGPQMPVK